MEEMNAVASKAAHGKVYPITKQDYAREITEASKTYPVLLHLSSSSHGNVESRLLSELFRAAAEKFPEVKFCECIAEMCIENYPEKNCPTILVYKEGDLSKNMIGLGEMRGCCLRFSLLHLGSARRRARGEAYPGGDWVCGCGSLSLWDGHDLFWTVFLVQLAQLLRCRVGEVLSLHHRLALPCQSRICSVL